MNKAVKSSAGNVLSVCVVVVDCSGLKMLLCYRCVSNVLRRSTVAEPVMVCFNSVVD